MRPDQAWEAVASLFGPPPHGSGRDDADFLPEHWPPRLRACLSATGPVRLETENVRLFVNALPEVPCPPYASFHKEGTLQGETTAEVRALYRRWGVESSELADHFAVEAAFLAALLRAAPENDAAARDAAWLTEHLRAWTPAFFRAVEGNDRTGVYREAVRLARSLLEESVAGRSGEPMA